MRIFFKYLGILVVLFGVFSAQAGSYDDFFAAVKRDHDGALQALLSRGFDANTVDPSGLSGLYLALRDENLKAAKVLVLWPRTDVNLKTPKDETPLMIAALKGHLDFVKLLLARGADVNKTGWTPLHYAATGGHLQIMQLLLDQHAYIDAESPNGTTPLMMAAGYGSDLAVKLLLEGGADPTLKNQLGLSALDFAKRVGNWDSIELMTAALQTSRPKAKW